MTAIQEILDAWGFSVNSDLFNESPFTSWGCSNACAHIDCVTLESFLASDHKDYAETCNLRDLWSNHATNFKAIHHTVLNILEIEQKPLKDIVQIDFIDFSYVALLQAEGKMFGTLVEQRISQRFSQELGAAQEILNTVLQEAQEYELALGTPLREDEPLVYVQPFSIAPIRHRRLWRHLYGSTPSGISIVPARFLILKKLSELSEKELSERPGLLAFMRFHPEADGVRLFSGEIIEEWSPVLKEDSPEMLETFGVFLREMKFEEALGAARAISQT